MKREFRIPTILALFALIIGLGSTLALMDYSQQLFSQASPKNTPKELRITNVTDTTATISWLTDQAVVGSVSYTDGSTQLTQIDDRLASSTELKTFTHFVTIRNLKASTTYTFSLINGASKIEDKSFTFTTGARLSAPTLTLEPAYGQITDEQNKPAEGAIVYFTYGNSAPLSTLVKKTGAWMIVVNGIRTADGKAYYEPKTTDQETIVVQLTVDKNASAVTTREHDHPVPTIIIGKKFDFTSENTKLPNTNSKKMADAAILGEQKSALDAVKNRKITINLSPTPAKGVTLLVPAPNGTFASPNPQFRGTGIPGKKVIITVQSKLQSGTAIVDSEGVWTWSPPENLEPGEHTVTMITSDEKGNNVTTTRKFIVFKSGTQVLGDATPSASLTPSPILSPSPTSTPSATTPTPTSTITPTPTIILTRTPTPTIATSSGRLPRSGTVEVTYALISVGLLLFFFGSLRLMRYITL